MTTPNVTALFQHRDWSSLPVEQIAPGITRQMIWGDRLMVCRLTIAAHVVTPVHSHAHEQITLVERGRARFFIEGEVKVVSAGDLLVFPSNCQHGATMLDEEVVLIDIFSPPREDFIAAINSGS